ncbi:MAG: ornithine--oxo-acid transaminase [Alphaproteobacteria bacterium CG_4_9_14_3_um_filter_47_13]|nr:MAG: ornithine--oxo-acid transaminase [Alphaproteobacteria bacterium CG_4_9_14_3_um_filter_47_13]
MKTQDYIDRENKYLAHNYHPLPLVLKKGEGIWLRDINDNKYLDFLSAYSAVSAGHLNPRIKKAMIDQLNLLDVPSRAFYTDKLGAFAEKLCTLTGMDAMLPMNTGTEAVETAIKAARRWGYEVKNIAQDKAEIIVSKGNFHGRSTTIVGFSSDPEYKRDFGPFDDGFKTIPFGDADALEKAITPETCAFLTEPVQGEGGIIIPPEGWLKQAQEICKKHNILFILDEIQSGMGRTGKNFAFQHEIDKPDGLILGKALGGGIYPVSAFLSRKDVMDLFQPGSHGSTFGGNPIAAAIGLEAILVLEEDNLARKSAELGQYLKDRLKEIHSPLITDIRGIGLWIGMDIDPEKATARDICERLQHKGLLCKETHETVVRFAPPLTITKENIDWALEQIRFVLDEMGHTL